MQSLSHNKYRTAGPRLSNSQKGSVPPIYTKGDTLYSTVVVVRAPRDRSCARREARERMERSRCARWEGMIASNARFGPVPLPLLPLRLPGSVPPIYTKGATLYYTNVIAEAPRERSCARREALERMERSRCARGRV